MEKEKLELVHCSRYPLKFWIRPGTSDIKAIKEVVERNSYQKPRKNFKIEKGERWIDLGANIGAFSILAAHLGAARVDAYEACPDSFELLKKNIELNGLTDRIAPFHRAVVADRQKRAWLSVSEKNKNFWRNSLVKQWKGSRMVPVPCIHFSEVFELDACVKMDIEGSEMPILEKLSFGPPKLVFEWSFDIDSCCVRFRSAMAHLAPFFKVMDYRPIPENVVKWPGEWFPAAMTVFCRKTSV